MTSHLKRAYNADAELSLTSDLGEGKVLELEPNPSTSTEKRSSNV